MSKGLNGVSPRGLPKGNDEATLNRRREMLEEVVFNEMMHRSEWFRSLIDRRRDMEREFHYPALGTQISATEYRQLYDRDSIAARVVQLMPRECFQVQPSVYEDESSENTTEFEEAVDALGDQLGEGGSWYREEKGSRLWEYIRRADELSGIGHFGILLIGIDDGLDLSQPVEGVVTVVGDQEYKDTPISKDQAETLKTLNNLNAHEVKVIDHLIANAEKGYKHGNGPTSGAYSSSGPLFGQHPMGTDQQYFGTQFGTYGQSEQMGDTPYKGCRKLLYLRAFDESLIQIVRWESNPGNPRFGRPVMYRVTLTDPNTQHTGVGLPLATVFVHWSRVIHLADNLGSSEVMGVPRMQPVYNDIIATYKTRHAGAEGYWRGAIPGLKFATHPALGGDVDVNISNLKDTAEHYQEGLQRMLYGIGGSWETIAPVFADPTPVHNLAIECICVQLGCPVRIFKGSERGELASSQDDAQWNDRIMSRQWTYITPRIIIPLFDRLILMGVLPEPCQEVEERKSGMDLPSLPEDAADTTEEALEEGAEPTEEPPTPKKKFPPQFSQNRQHPVGQIYSVRRKRKVMVRNEETGEVTEKTVVEKANAVRTAKGYVVEWPELDSMTLMDKAKYAQTMVASLAAYTSGGCEAMVTRKDYFTKYELRDDEEAEAMVCDAEEQAIQDEEEAALKAAEQGLEVDPNDPTTVVDPEALPPGVTEVDEDGNPTIPKGTAPPPSFAKKGGPPQPGGFPPKKGKPPIGNANPEGCNQHTGPGCGEGSNKVDIESKEWVKELKGKVGDKTGKTLETTGFRFNREGLIPAADTFFSKERDYVEEFGKEVGGKGEIVEKKVTLSNPLHVLATRKQFSDYSFENPIIERAKKEGYDGIIFSRDNEELKSEGVSQDDIDLLYSDEFYVTFGKPPVGNTQVTDEQIDNLLRDVLNANPEGCNQHTGPNCGGGRFTSQDDIDTHMTRLKSQPESEVDKELDAVGVKKKERASSKDAKIRQLGYALQEELETSKGKSGSNPPGGGGKSRINWNANPEGCNQHTGPGCGQGTDTTKSDTGDVGNEPQNQHDKEIRHLGVKRVVTDTVAEWKYKEPVNVIDQDGPVFEKGGIQWREGGNCKLASGEVTIHSGTAGLTVKAIERLTAHELMHGSFEKIHTKYLEERSDIAQREKEIVERYDTANPGVDLGIRARAINEMSLTRASGTLKPEYEKEYPTYSRFIKFIDQTPHEDFIRDDGVTPYSEAYWRDYKDGKVSFHIAVHETLAEIAGHHQETGVIIGSKLFKDYYKATRDEYRVLSGSQKTRRGVGIVKNESLFRDHETYLDEDFNPTTPDKAKYLRWWKVDGSNGLAVRAEEGPPKPPIGNANPEGCNQHTGPGCSGTSGDTSETFTGKLSTSITAKSIAFKGKELIDPILTADGLSRKERVEQIKENMPAIKESIADSVSKPATAAMGELNKLGIKPERLGKFTDKLTRSLTKRVSNEAIEALKDADKTLTAKEIASGKGVGGLPTPSTYQFVDSYMDALGESGISHKSDGSINHDALDVMDKHFLGTTLPRETREAMYGPADKTYMQAVASLAGQFTTNETVVTNQDIDTLLYEVGAWQKPSQSDK